LSMQDKELTQNRLKLAQACRILFMEGLADYNLGHASFRVSGKELVCIKPQGLGLEEVTPEDLIVIDFTGKKISGNHPAHGENPIHIGIYKTRGDVGSVVHVHPVLATAFSSSDAALRPLNQEGVIFPRGVPVFESPELVTTEAQARSLARTLGDESAVILRNHGIVTVGPRIEEACLNALFFEGALRIQRAAAQFGKIKAISERTALKMYEQCRNPRRYDMIWNYLVRKLKRSGLALPDGS
ncbi:MAG: class II aldolase/adducin family protein, partial [Thermodesulfobacteriota bacterium]